MVNIGKRPKPPLSHNPGGPIEHNDPNDSDGTFNAGDVTNGEIDQALQNEKDRAARYDIIHAHENDDFGTSFKEGFLHGLQHPILTFEQLFGSDEDRDQLQYEMAQYHDSSWWNIFKGPNIKNILTDPVFTGADGKKHSLLSEASGGLGESYTVDAIYIGLAVLALAVILKV